MYVSAVHAFMDEATDILGVHEESAVPKVAILRQRHLEPKT